MLNGKQSKVLPAINGAQPAYSSRVARLRCWPEFSIMPHAALKKLCNHPKLIYDMLAHTTEAAADGFKDCDQFFTPVRAAWPCAQHQLCMR